MPTIPIEETDYAAGSGALSGERVFKNTVPATTAREQTFNTIWHNLRKIVTEAGVSNDLSAASYAADLAAGFPNLSKAIRRLARRSRYDELSIVSVTDDYMFSPGRDKFVFIIENQNTGPYGDGSTVYINHLDVAQDSYRTILVHNNSGEAKMFVDAINSINTVLLQDQESCFFTALPTPSPDTGPDLYWTPVGRPLYKVTTGTFDVKAFQVGGAASSGTVAMEWSHHENGTIVSVNVDSMGFTPSVSDYTLSVLTSAGAALPAEVRSKYTYPNSRIFLVSLIIGSTQMVGTLSFDGLSSDIMIIRRLDGALFTSGVNVVVRGFELTYFLKQ